MRIAYITAGAAGMYCGSCLHDNTLAAALRRAGEDITLIPIYTPIRTDEEDVSLPEVFYGAVNVYLQQRVGLFRHTPRAVDRWLDQPALLDRVARLGSSTNPSDLGDLTLSMLDGEDGRQVKELRRLLAWLRDDLKPDIVHLTNSMLLGMARTIRAELAVPVVCSVQGEDLFLDQLAEPYRQRVLTRLKQRAKDVDLFVATSRYYRDHMASYLDVDPGAMAVIGLGIRVDDFRPHEHERPPVRPFTVGYLARIAPEKGLHHLVEALALLSQEIGMDKVALRVAGYLGPRDRAYYQTVCQLVAAAGLDPIFEYVGEVDRDAKLRFLHSLDVLSVPTVYAEAKGLFAIEAMASGIATVLPRHGSLVEMVNESGGGLLFDPASPRSLADALRTLYAEPVRRAKLGVAGRTAAVERYSDNTMATAMMAVYRRLVAA